MNLRALLLVVTSLAAINAYASIALAATKVAAVAEKAASEATEEQKPTAEAPEFYSF